VLEELRRASPPSAASCPGRGPQPRGEAGAGVRRLARLGGSQRRPLHRQPHRCERRPHPCGAGDGRAPVATAGHSRGLPRRKAERGPGRGGGGSRGEPQPGGPAARAGRGRLGEVPARGVPAGRARRRRRKGPHDAIRRDRHLRTWTDAQGAFCGGFRTTPDAGARMLAVLEAETNRMFKAARSQSRREPHAAYAVDALEALLCSGGGGKGARPCTRSACWPTTTPWSTANGRGRGV
jgi:hypothetical protein